MKNKEELWEDYSDLVKKERWNKVIELLYTISSLEPKNHLVYLRMGDAYQKTGQKEMAVSSYHKAAAILYKEGFKDKTLALYKMILKIDTDDSVSLKRLDEILKEQETLRPATISALGKPMEEIEPVEEPLTSESGAIGELSLFSGMSAEELSELKGKLIPLSFQSEDRIVEEGDSGDSLFIIKKGIAKVITHIGGKEIGLATLSDGDIFGEVAFLTGRPRTASVIASTDIEVFEIGRADLEELTGKYPRISEILQGFYESRVQETVQRVKAELRP